jgi:hypothetical protein
LDHMQEQNNFPGVMFRTGILLCVKIFQRLGWDGEIYERLAVICTVEVGTGLTLINVGE